MTVITVGEKIKARRIEIGMTQQELSELAGYKNKTAISHLENDQMEMSSQKLRAVAYALRVSPSYLMSDDSYEDYNNTVVKNMVLKHHKTFEKMSLLNDADQSRLIHIIDAYVDSINSEKDKK